MSALSDFHKNKILDHILRNVPYSQDGTLYVGLFTSNPGESGVSGELVIGTGGYARAVVTNNSSNFPPCSLSGSPTKTNGAIIQFPTATLAWGTVTHWAIYSASSGGTNMLFHGALTSPRYIAASDAPKIAAGALSITITNTAGGGLTAYSQRKWLDHILGGPSYTPVAVCSGLGTSLSGEDIDEWAESSYARKPTTFSAASGGVTSNTAAVTFTTNVLDGTETINSYGIWDSLTAGNLLLVGPVSTSRTIINGDTAMIAIGGLVVTAQ